MNVLLHICCGPCAIMPIRRLLDEGHTVTGYFYNPNIHPLTEYLRRREGAEQVAARYGIAMRWAVAPEDYNTLAWLRMVSAQQDKRCPLCWGQRLERVFAEAKAGGFDAFTSSLLYSRYQQHDYIAQKAADLAGNNAATTPSPIFLYKDFRPDWQEGINISKEWNIYRQQYCGCLFSENERYAKTLTKSNEALAG